MGFQDANAAPMRDEGLAKEGDDCESELQQQSAQVLAAAAKLLGMPRARAGNARLARGEEGLGSLNNLLPAKNDVEDEIEELGLDKQFPISSASRGTGKLPLAL